MICFKKALIPLYLALWSLGARAQLNESQLNQWWQQRNFSAIDSALTNEIYSTSVNVFGIVAAKEYFSFVYINRVKANQAALRLKDLALANGQSKTVTVLDSFIVSLSTIPDPSVSENNLTLDFWREQESPQEFPTLSLIKRFAGTFSSSR